MPDDSSFANSLSTVSKIMATTTVTLAAFMGTSYLAGTGGDPSSKGPAIVVGAQHVPTDKLEEMHHVQRMRAPLHDFFGIEIETEEPIAQKDTGVKVYCCPTPVNADQGPSNPNHPQAPASDGDSNSNKSNEEKLCEKEQKRDEIAWKVNDKLAKSLQDYSLNFLVMTVADPIDAVSNAFFDQQLDTLQKALAADPYDSWIYSGGYLPWQAFKDHRNLVKEIPLFRKKHWYMDEPGVLVFRKEKRNAKRKTKAGKVVKSDHERDANEVESDEQDQLLLVYLVGEVPTLGIQRDALTHAIHDIFVLTSVFRPSKSSLENTSTPKPISDESLDVRIIGPTFTGGAHSLREGLKQAQNSIACKMGLPKPTPYKTPFDALIINGSSTAIPDDYFDDPGTHYVARTVCKSDEIIHALRRVVSRGNPPILWLTETGTGIGDEVRHSDQRYPKLIDKNDIFIPVPVGISRVRGTFERQMTAAKQQSIGLPVIASLSPLPFEPDETAHDTPPIQTPQITAPIAELLLNQIMRTIISENVSFVGLMATDVRDTIFLAEMLKLHCPHVQLLIAEPDILLTHTSYTDSLRGAITASSYPLFAEGLRLCWQEEDDKSLPVMGGPAQYGIYNAILMQRTMAIRKIRLPAFKVERDSKTMEIDRVYSSGLVQDAGLIGPRVWLHTIGYDRFYPLGISHLLPNKVDDPLGVGYSSKSQPHKTQFLFRVNPAWYSLAIGFFLFWAAIVYSWRDVNILGGILEPLHRCSSVGNWYWQAFRISALSLFAIATVTLLGCLYVFHFSSGLDHLAIQAESYFFSGVTLLLPLFSASAAGIVMCYMKMRQSFLVSYGRTSSPSAIQKQTRSFETCWIGFGDQLPYFTSLISWLVSCVCGPIWCLFLIFLSTNSLSEKPVFFWTTWFIIAVGYVLWWLCALELYIFQRQLRDKAKGLAPKLTDVDKNTLSALHTIGDQQKNGLRGVYRMLFGPSPTDHDPVAKCAANCTSDAIGLLLDFREIQYRFLVIKNQFVLLLMGALLLFGAVVAYPFSSQAMMRSLATFTILTLVIGICLCFWKLERDENLSEFLGTTPNDIEFNLNNLSFFGGYGLIGILVLVSQFVPGSWMTMGRVLGPLLHMGH